MPPGGYGYPPGGGGYPPPPGGGNNNGRNAAIAIGAVVVVGAIIGGIVLASSGGDDKKPDALTSSSSSSSTSAFPTPTVTLPTDLPTLDIPTDLPTTGSTSSSPTPDLVPYVVLNPGKCFDHPGLDSSVSVVTTRSCSSPHDGEVVANETLTGSFTTETELQSKVLKLCEPDAKKRLARIPADGKTYYYYALYPSLMTYQIQKKDTISCSLTLSNKVDGKKLTKALP
ncbi:hypothetical protein G3I60_34070 [Streptomyces sp. SID13666]|uniref:hypothetical protein n=1 Tax=Streptomyces TaxID=1883 RepID=UPI001106E3F8|nr:MULTISPECIES: hypothetical protein [Streptomyces]NEA59052.1 hypothetical protein [Streptomyces sp. SID13666]NEA74472.1 hypothetical protein [Streptomyces sp. SID13588]QNA72879.1 hypothetical protein C8250_014000 [Streptomyces sp. So13.3]